MLTRKIIILLLFFLTTISFSIGQAPLITYNVKNGLSQNSVTCIYQDKTGIMWIGTQDGLNKFDGYRFVHYKYDESDTTSISDQFITAINEDGNGNLLIGTRNGLNYFNHKTEKFARIYPNPSGRNVIQCEFNPIHKKNDGNLIMAGAGEIFEWDRNNKKIKKLNNHLSNGFNFSVYKNSYVQINSNREVIISDGIKTKEKILLEQEKDNHPTQFIDKHHTIWWLKQTGGKKFLIAFFDLEKMQWKKEVIETEENISNIIFDKNNQPIILTQNGLFTLEKNKKLKPFELGGWPLTTPALCALRDKDGILWIGFMNNGIGLYNQKSQTFHLISNNIKNDACYSAIEISADNIWMATASGLYQSNQKNKTVKKLSDIPTTSLVSDINNIWAGTAGNGLFLLNKSGKQISHFTKENSSLIGNTIFHLNYHKKNNCVIISTPVGVSVFFPLKKEWITLNFKNGKLAGSYVMHSFTDSKNNTWISSNMGVDVFDENFHLVLRINSDSDTSRMIKRTIITGSTEDRNGSIWISSLSNGVYKYDKGRITRYNVKNGLSSNVIYGVACDKENRIWVAGTNGINVIDQRDGSIEKITKENGLPTTDYSIGSLHTSSSGMMYIGSPDGVIRILPEKAIKENIKYATFVKKVEVNYQPIPIEPCYLLQSDDKQISFEFSTPCYINSDQLIFQYRLNGFVDRWITLSASDNRKLNFINLPYKSLVLEVRAAMTLLGIESAPVLQINITRKPPLWRDLRFLIPLILSVLIVLILSVRYLAKRKIKQQLREAAINQSIYKERERISRDLHDSLGAYTAAIKSNVIQLEQESESTQQTLTQLKENAEDMVSALRENIWALQHEHIDITSISDRFKNIINRISPNYPELIIDFKEDIQNNILLSPGESIHLLRIMQETITNAIKHAKCNKISVSIFVKEHLNVSIADNGTGFEFNQDRNKYGIKNMKNRAAESGFDLSIDSSDKGTVITVKK